MKKLFALLLVTVIILSFAGCSKKGTADVDTDASSETVIISGDNVMPDTESKTGDAVIDINELFEDSTSSTAKTGSSASTSQTASSSGVSAESSSKSGNSSIAVTSSSTSSVAGASQIVGGTDTASGYTSGWVN